MTQPSDLRAEAARLYDERNGPAALVALAESVWGHAQTKLPSGAGAAARYAGAACADAARPPGGPPDLAMLAASRLWFARAIAAAAIEEDWPTVAGALLPNFFACVEIGQWEAARRVLEEVRRLVPDTHDEWDRLVGRVYHEKSGFCLLMEGRYPDAAEAYRQARRFTGGDPRGALKVRGGLALAEYLSDPGADHDAVTETQAVLTDATGWFEDVERWATTNLAVMEQQSVAGWVPYEVV